MCGMTSTPKSKEGTMKRFLEIGGVAAGVVLIAFGVAAIVLSMNGKSTVATELKNQQIVGTPDMTPKGIKAQVAGQAWAKDVTLPTCSVAGQAVNNGDRARCFAQYMRIHTLEATQGVPYALMGRYTAKPGTPAAQLTADKATNNTQYAVIDPTTKQPVENGARQIWVTETALTTALNSSYMAEQMANFGLVVGIALLLAGFGFGILAVGGALENEWAFGRKPKKAETTTAAPIGA
jgi:F0F1-type ATP synthase membrane subunit c/vacuolar-type H+-ATPase subunit K